MVKVISVNVGMPRIVPWNGMTVQTGIFKSPVEGAVVVRRRNLDGDRQADLTVHGGLQKAVYGYPSEHYEYWRQDLPDVAFGWGQFGENLTTEGLLEEELNIGDQLKMGSAILTVTQPRLPCYKLTIRFHREDIIKRFLKSRRSGFYFSVRQEGEVSARSEIEVVSRDPNRVSVADISRLYFSEIPDPDVLQRARRVSALPESWKEDLIARAQARQR